MFTCMFLWKMWSILQNLARCNTVYLLYCCTIHYCQQCLWWLSLATVKVGFYIKCPIFCPILTKWGFPSQISIQVPNNQVSQQPVKYDLIWSMWTDRHDEVNTCFSWVCTHTQTLKTVTSQYYFSLFLLSTCQRSLQMTKNSHHIQGNYTYSNHRKTVKTGGNEGLE
jgi:hypothetical protein